MKRSSSGGGQSPSLKHLILTGSSDSDDDFHVSPLVAALKERESSPPPPSSGSIGSIAITSSQDNDASSVTHAESIFHNFGQFSKCSLSTTEGCSVEEDHLIIDCYEDTDDNDSDETSSSSVVFNRELFTNTPPNSQANLSSPYHPINLSPCLVESSHHPEIDQYIGLKNIELGSSVSGNDECTFSEDDKPCKIKEYDEKRYSIPLLLENWIQEIGLSSVADKLLEHDALRTELSQKIFKKAHGELKSSIKSSKLKKENDREYLLTLTPMTLCEEFREKSPLAFTLLVKGLFGFSDETELFQSQKLLNSTCLIFSIIA